MGDVNQSLFAQEHRDRLTGPCLEVGSRDYGNTQDLRSMFPGETYVGVDLIKTLWLLGLYKWLFGNRYLILPTTIDMVGVLRNDA